MRNSVAVRLVIGVGLLLGLFVVTTALSFWQTRLVDGKIRDVTEVQEPSRAAAYEMQLTATATGVGVLWFVSTGDEQYRQKAFNNQASFQQSRAEYDRLAESPEKIQLSARVGLLSEEYHALARALMIQADEERALFSELAADLRELMVHLDQGDKWNISPTKSLTGPAKPNNQRYCFKWKAGSQRSSPV